MKKRIHQYAFYGIHTIAPLLLGLLIYRLFPQGIGTAVFSVPFGELQAAEPPVFPTPAAGILRCYVPDMLWAYALTFSVSGILGYSARKCPLVFCICVGFGGLMEFFQKWQLFPGTFDPLDIALESASVLAALLIIHLYQRSTLNTHPEISV